MTAQTPTAELLPVEAETLTEKELRVREEEAASERFLLALAEEIKDRAKTDRAGEAARTPR